jgi:hypothetical protein
MNFISGKIDIKLKKETSFKVDISSLFLFYYEANIIFIPQASH